MFKVISFLCRALRFPFRRVKRFLGYFYLLYNGVEVSYPGPVMDMWPIIVKCQGSRIILGDRCVFASGWRLNPAGVSRKVALVTLSSKAVIDLKSGVQLSGAVICAVQGVSIGSNTLLGVNVSIYDTDFHPITYEKRVCQKSVSDAQSGRIAIGEGVWVGAYSTILKGVSLGDRCVIGAHSLVNKSLERDCICAGVPCKMIKLIS